MTPSEQSLARQLHDFVCEKFGSIKRFCNLYHYKYEPIATFLNGNKKFSEDLYESIYEQVVEAKIDVNSEVVLLDIVIRKYFKTYEAFCKAAHIAGSTLARVMKNTDDAAFKKICFIAYSKALHEIEGIEGYVNKLAPGEFINDEARRSRSLQQIKKYHELERNRKRRLR